MARLTLKTQPDIAAALEQRRRWLESRKKPFLLKPPVILHPVPIEREYTRDLLKRFTLLFELTQTQLIDRLPSLLAQAAAELEPQRFDAFPDELDSIINGIGVEFARELTDSELQSLAKLHGTRTSEWNRAQNDKVFKAVLGVDVFRSEPYIGPIMQSFAQANSNLITTLSQRHINDVRGIALQGVRQGLSAKAVEELIRARVGKTEANLRLIARDQVSKLNGQLTKVRQTGLGVKSYIWRTSLDERVRHSHRVKEGVEFDWAKAPADTGHPGEDFQCRCYPEPKLEELIGPEEGIAGGALFPFGGITTAAAIAAGVAFFTGEDEIE